MRAARRGKVRVEFLGYRTSIHDPEARIPVNVINTPYTASRFPRGRAKGLVEPAAVRRSRDEVTALALSLVADLEAGHITSAEADRRRNDLSAELFRRDCRTAEGLAYYREVFRRARRTSRNAARELLLIKADRRDKTRVPKLRADYGRRSR